jgi:beta-xylosidase
MIRNPVIDRGPEQAARDVALAYEGGVFRCFHTCSVRDGDRYQLTVDLVESADLVAWSAPKRLTTSRINFSSPGNAVRVGSEWILCVQSYPIDPGQVHGSEDSRLWLMRSRDLVHWRQPVLITAAGCQANWTSSHRQIDPYLVEHDGKFWCLYKTAGNLGLLVSEDLAEWREASPDRPILRAEDTPDGSTVENPCVVRVDGSYALFFAPCRKGRGIGLAYSDDLLDWHNVHYLDFPELPWASGGPTAPTVLDLREELGMWLMGFHGQRHTHRHAHGAAIGLAWSSDLEHWLTP